jgi:hypothetical protein
MGEKQGEHTRSVHTLAIGAGDWRVCILDRAQDIKLGLAVQAGILVERHFPFQNKVSCQHFRWANQV